MLSIAHLQKSFGDRLAVDDVSFEVRSGETVGLLGPNGAGKTTTLSMMSGISKPVGGSVSFRGQRVHQDANAQHGPSIPYTVATEKMTTAQNVPYNGYAHSLAGMTTQFILLAGIDAGLLLLLARERGIWQRLRAAPLSKAEFLLARTIATALITYSSSR